MDKGVYGNSPYYFVKLFCKSKLFPNKVVAVVVFKKAFLYEMVYNVIGLCILRMLFHLHYIDSSGEISCLEL